MKQSIANSLGFSIAIQGLGSLPSFILVILLARIAGPETQGTYSIFKTWIDLFNSILIFGFPQAFVYLINKNISPRHELLNFCFIYFFASNFLLILMIIFSLEFGYINLPDGQTPLLYILAISIGGSAYVFNRLVRGIYLTIDDRLIFALATSAPAFFILISMLVATQLNAFPYDIAYFACGLSTLAVTAVWVKRIINLTPSFAIQIPKLPLGSLVNQSMQSFVQSLCFTIQPVISIWTMLAWGANIVDVAFFSASIIIISIANLLFGIVNPIMFNKWSKKLEIDAFIKIIRASVYFSIIFAFIGLLGIAVMPFAVFYTFGPSYHTSVWAFRLLLFAMPAVAFTRMLYPAIHAAGAPSYNTVSCLVRVGVAWGSQVALAAYAGMSPLLSAIWCWILSEWCASIYTWLAAKTLQRELL
jgi:O-antigen/teichoic acid export membrane protein